MKTLNNYINLQEPIGNERIFFELCKRVAEHKKEFIISVETQEKVHHIIKKLGYDKALDIVVLMD